jgi:hypothetical protein
MTLAFDASAAPSSDERPLAPAYFECLHYAHTAPQPPLLLATHRVAGPYDALGWVITRGCHIAEQIDAEPRRQLHARVLAPELQRELPSGMRESRIVTLEIAAPDILFELSVRPAPTETS